MFRWRMSQIGLVDADMVLDCNSFLQAGQRLVSLREDLWRWEWIFGRGADSMRPSASALRLQNKLTVWKLLKQGLEQATQPRQRGRVMQ